MDLKVNDMMAVQARSKLIEFGRQQQSEVNKQPRFQEKETSKKQTNRIWKTAAI